VKYLLRCLQCGATQWVIGSFECPETGAVDLEDEDDSRRVGGNCNCKHSEFEVTDSEINDDYYDD